MVDLQSDVVVVGDGPTGLQAALMLAKAKLTVRVLGMDATGTNEAMLLNYLGMEGTHGRRFMALARLQAEHHGAHLHRLQATACEVHGEGVRVQAGEGNAFFARYLVLATGKDASLASALRLPVQDGRLQVDPAGRTSLDRVYAGGRLARGHASQVATSVGDGAAIALDILARERGKVVHDWDVAPRQPPVEHRPGRPAA